MLLKALFFDAFHTLVTPRPYRIDGLEVFHERDYRAGALNALRAADKDGMILGIAGDFSLEIDLSLRGLGIVSRYIAISPPLGEKLDALFARIIAATGLRPGEIGYVSSRYQNCYLAFDQAGLRPIFIAPEWSRQCSSEPAKLAEVVLALEDFTAFRLMLPALDNPFARGC